MNDTLEVPREVLDSIENGETQRIAQLTITARGTGVRARKGSADRRILAIYATKDSEGNLTYSQKEVGRITG